MTESDMTPAIAKIAIICNCQNLKTRGIFSACEDSSVAAGAAALHITILSVYGFSFGLRLRCFVVNYGNFGSYGNFGNFIICSATALPVELGLAVLWPSHLQRGR